MGPSIGAYSGLLAITFPYLLLKISNEAIDRSWGHVSSVFLDGYVRNLEKKQKFHVFRPG